MTKGANCFDAVKVFSATMQPGREAMGEQMTSWLASNPSVSVVDVSVTQSSDAGFHCLTIVLFFVERARSNAM